MHPSRKAEELLGKSNVASEREEALVWAVLAVAQAIEGLGTDVLEAARNIAVELGDK